MNVAFKLNGRPVSWNCEPGETLRDALRRKGIVSVRNGCDGEGSCGLCAVILDRKPVNSCQILAAQVDGCEVVTVEHFSKDRTLSIVQRALVDAACVQCGYCIPAVVLAIEDLLARDPDPGRAAIADALAGTMCRCTGYEQFFSAVRIAARRLSDPAYAEAAAPEFRPDLRHVGKDREKVDAACLARGERAFVEDRVDQDACHLLLLGSPHAHAWIKSIDVSRAEAMPGVVAVLTHENCPDKVYTTAGQGFPEPSPHDQRMFPRKVRHVGDRVAAVLAETPEEARAALEAIRVEYEVLEPVLSIAAAKAPGAPIVHSGRVGYVVGEPPKGTSVAGDDRDDPIIYQFPLHADPHRNLAASVADGIGDMEKGFAEADVVIERTYKGNRVQCTPQEPHVVYAKVDGGRLLIHASTQVPWHVRRIVARAIGIPEVKVRVIKERVGGGFGSKQDIVLEDVAGYLAWTTGRPVFFRYTREQEFIASRTRKGMEITVKLGARRDGKLTAILMRLDADTGPYGTHCLTVPMNAISKSLPLLLCDNVRFEVKSYYTNLSPAGAYQGYGAPKGSFALQTALAELAAELGMDQLELIEKNRVRSHSRLDILRSLGEGRPGAVVTLGECGLGEMLDRGRKAFDWSSPRPASPDPDWKIGRGGVIIQQGSGLPGLDAANAEMRLLADGTVLVLSGGADLGTGLDTITAKAAAEILGLDMADVSVVSGDTDMTPFDSGAYASSGTFFSGGAAVKAAENLRDKILEVASKLLGEDAADLSIVPRGRVVGRKGEITLAQLAHMSTQGEGHGDLVGIGGFKTNHAAIPYGAHFAEVAVNVRTGDVKVRRFHAYQDCGTPINPALAKGQIFGACLKALGHSLYEEMIYDAEGRCLNPDFLDYKVPSIREVPEDFHVELMPVADEVGPFGGKSVSEIAVNGAAPAVAIAIHDAVGAWVREWPFTPERILKAMGRL
ncbi:MAG TPA: molybdopterin-dependent oxidoreductase Mo/Fe-S-binding subunit [Holophaga sp.]|nr:molybdopterin-dependent oxidoreductase Mo/Fe-S-binding subunit [Holophaga sp.]HPS68816.1 molybdopterin-dependent oxidoreductase Mo/Fe-S-binding subunit [Holophaga sp.]